MTDSVLHLSSFMFPAISAEHPCPAEGIEGSPGLKHNPQGASLKGRYAVAKDTTATMGI